MKKSIALLAAVGALVVAGSAQAQDKFGSQGQMAFSADRLFGVYGFKATTSYNQPNYGTIEYSVSGSQFGLLWGTSSVSGAGEFGGFGANPYAVPRLSFDYFVIDNLSVGGSLGYAKQGGTLRQEKGPGAANVDLNDRSMFVIAPRVGYSIMFNDWVGFWPRGGFTYATLHDETDAGDETSYDIFSLDVEAMFVFIPKEHFAFTVGPVLDFGLTGGYEYKNHNPNTTHEPYWDQDVKLHTYGLAAGILGYF